LVLVERGGNALGLEADFLCLPKVQPEVLPDDPDRLDLAAAGSEDPQVNVVWRIHQFGPLPRS
jgi:hypothetical protein